MPDLSFKLWFVYPCEPTLPGIFEPDAGVLQDEAFILRIDCASGDVYELTVWTDAYLAWMRRHDRELGDRLGGQYLILPDLVVAQRDVELIEQIAADLVQTQRLRSEWLIPDEFTAEWDALSPAPADEAEDTWMSTLEAEMEYAGWSCCHGRPVL